MSKRVNGAGSVKQMQNGRWRWTLTLGYRIVGDKTKRDEVGGTASTKKAAEIALADAITMRDRGLLAVCDRVTVSEFIETWFSRLEGLNTRSVAMYRKELSYALEHIGKMKVKDVRAPHLKNLMTTLAARPMGRRDKDGNPPKDAKVMNPRTLGKVLTHLRAVFAEAVVDQIIYANPCEGVRKPKSAPLEHVGTVFDFDQAARFHELGEALHAAGVCALWPAIRTCVSIGLRRSEVMGLRWKDVDFKNKILRIRHTNVLQTDGTMGLAEVTKTHASRRDIDMPPSFRVMLEEHQANQNKHKERAGDAWQDSGAVFATAQGRWVSPDNLGRALSNLLEWSDSKHLLERYKSDSEPSRTAKKGEEMTNLERRMRAVKVDHRPRLEAIVRAGVVLPDIRVHDLRHTYATLALRSKVPVAVVSKTLGHARISITMDIYRHVLPSEMKENVFDMFAVPVPVRNVQAIAVN
jgi:integrase